MRYLGLPPTPYVMTLEISEFSESAHTDGVAEMEQIIGARPRFVVKSEGTLSGSARLIRTFQDSGDRSVVDLYELRDGPL